MVADTLEVLAYPDPTLRQEVKSLYEQVYAINRQALEKHARHDAFDKIIAD